MRAATWLPANRQASNSSVTKALGLSAVGVTRAEAAPQRLLEDRTRTCAAGRATWRRAVSHKRRTPQRRGPLKASARARERRGAAARRTTPASPAIALAATVGGLASHTGPGRSGPGKLRLIALTVTWSASVDAPGPQFAHAPHAGCSNSCADRFERLEVAALDAIVAHVDRAELQVQLHAVGARAARARRPSAAPRGSGRSLRACRRCTSRRRRCRCFGRSRERRAARRRCPGRRARHHRRQPRAVEQQRCRRSARRHRCASTARCRTSMPRRSRRKRRVSSSGATMPVKPPSSATMLVKRGAFVDRHRAHRRRRRTRTPCPRRRPRFSGGSASRCSTTSLAVTPAGSGPDRCRRAATRASSGAPRR